MTISNTKSDNGAVGGGNNGFLANTLQAGSRITADVAATAIDNVRTLFTKYNHPASESLRDAFSGSSSHSYNNHSNSMLHNKGAALKGSSSLTSSVKLDRLAGGMDRPHRRNNSNSHHPRRNASNIHHPHAHPLGHTGSKKKRADSRDMAHIKMVDAIDAR